MNRKVNRVRRLKPKATKASAFQLSYDGIIPVGLCIATVLAAIVMAPPLNAGAVVLAEMDCVVEPGAIVRIGSAVPGVLDTTFFDRSDYVNAGEVMGTLESRVERASLAIAEEVAAHGTSVSLRQATADFGERTRERNAVLLKTSSISQQNMDQVETETQIARLQVQQENENRRLAELRVQRERATLERRMIISPIAGTVVKRFKSTGEYVDRDPVFEIAQLDPLNVEVIVPLDNLGQIESGMRGAVTILAPGFDDQVLEATVRRIDSVSDAASATFGVRLELENPELKIPSGVRCIVDFYTS